MSLGWDGRELGLPSGVFDVEQPIHESLLNTTMAAMGLDREAIDAAYGTLRRIYEQELKKDPKRRIFNGPVARLSFIPANDTVDCDHITVNYMDGTSHDVFSGTLLADQKETITFPDRDSRLSSVNFSCKALTRDGARMDISAVTDGDGVAYNDPADRPANVRTYTDVYIR